MVKNGLIKSIGMQPLFNYDDAFICGDDEKTAFYGMIGTAYHSGNPSNQLVRYRGNPASIVNLSGKIAIGILNRLSVCAEEIDTDEIERHNLYSFFTPEVDLMPFLGYVVREEKITEPRFSFYETVFKKEGIPAIPAEETLPGDNLGQMCQLLCDGMSVKNSVCRTVLKNPFYGKVLNLSPSCGENPMAIMRPDTFESLFPGLAKSPLKDVMGRFPVEVECGGLYGRDRIMVSLTSDYTPAERHCLGFVDFFTSGKSRVIFSYEKADYACEAFYNGIFKA